MKLAAIICLQVYFTEVVYGHLWGTQRASGYDCDNNQKCLKLLNRSTSYPECALNVSFPCVQPNGALVVGLNSDGLVKRFEISPLNARLGIAGIAVWTSVNAIEKWQKFGKSCEKLGDMSEGRCQLLGVSAVLMTGAAIVGWVGTAVSFMKRDSIQSEDRIIYSNGKFEIRANPSLLYFERGMLIVQNATVTIEETPIFVLNINSSFPIHEISISPLINNTFTDPRRPRDKDNLMESPTMRYQFSISDDLEAPDNNDFTWETLYAGVGTTLQPMINLDTHRLDIVDLSKLEEDGSFAKILNGTLGIL